MEQIFISHSKHDVEYCEILRSACTEAGLFPYLAEYDEDTEEKPVWKIIKRQIQNSCALFIAIGKELVDRTEEHSKSWRYTQNWMSFEIGLACELGIDVWVFCDDVVINFPVPYLNQYLPDNLKSKAVFDSFVAKLNFYRLYPRVPFPLKSLEKNYLYECPACGAVYNLYITIRRGEDLTCPSCLNVISHPDGFPVI
jgi:hypothetical protein